MQQIADWLEGLGLSEYAQRFAENDIDFILLPELTDQDLEKIGVISLGHRRKILKAIAALRTDASIKAPLITTEPARPTAATATVASVAEAFGERRHVTVMFCDLVGLQASPRHLMQRTGAIWSARIWMLHPRP